MEKQMNYTQRESRSARCNAKVKSPARWRLIAELFAGPASRMHRYRDFSRRTIEETIDNYHCPKSCQ